MKRTAALAGVLLVLALTACSGPATPPVEKITPKPTASSAAEATPETEAALGSRDNPLPVGQQRKLSESSMWSVGAESATQVGKGYVALPVHISLDWEAGRAQGLDADADGADPGLSLFIEYVTSEGRSYDLEETLVDLPNKLYQVGTLYPPAADVSANYVVTVPDAEIPGGVWRVSNSNGDSVFLATE